MVVMKTKPLSNDNEMKQVPLFSGLSKTEIDSLKKLMTAVNIHSGKTVVREGDVGREFMIILSGTASVSREGSKFATFLRNNLVKTEDNYVIPIKGHSLSYLNFPLYGKSKQQLLQQSTQNLYNDILRETWSCWFPKNGKACGKCPMCRERVVEHPKND